MGRGGKYLPSQWEARVAARHRNILSYLCLSRHLYDYQFFEENVLSPLLHRTSYRYMSALYWRKPMFKGTSQLMLCIWKVRCINIMCCILHNNVYTSAARKSRAYGNHKAAYRFWSFYFSSTRQIAFTIEPQGVLFSKKISESLQTGTSCVQCGWCRALHGTIRIIQATYAAALKTTTNPKTRCRKPYAATQLLMLLMMGVCTRNMSS